MPKYFWIAGVTVACGTRIPSSPLITASIAGPRDAQTPSTISAAVETFDDLDAAPTSQAPPPQAPPEVPSCTPLVWSIACVGDEAPSEPLDSAHVEAWYRGRGAPVPRDIAELGCREGLVGPATEPALICDGIQHVTRGAPGTLGHAFRVLFRKSIRAVRNKTVVTIFDAVYGVDALDKEEEQGPLFTLVVTIARPSSSLTLSEPAPGACSEAAAMLVARLERERTEQDRVSLAWTRFDLQQLNRVCGARGVYAWKNGRFVRVSSPPASRGTGVTDL